MNTKTMAERIQAVRDAVDDASAGLIGGEHRSFLEELLAEAEGWRMQLEEAGEVD